MQYLLDDVNYRLTNFLAITYFQFGFLANLIRELQRRIVDVNGDLEILNPEGEYDLTHFALFFSVAFELLLNKNIFS